MADLDQLGLSEEAAPQVDWDTPEGGKTPPSVFPGTYNLRFEMPENRDDWFDAVERTVSVNGKDTKKKFLEVSFMPVVLSNAAGQAMAADNGEPLSLGTQRVNTFMTGKMRIHRVAELLLSMGVRLDQSNLLAIDANGKRVIENTLEQLNGKATFQAEVIWRAYFKSTDTTVSTSPRKKAGELPWPREANGLPTLLAKNPTNGETMYGYPEINVYKRPSAGAEGSENMASAAG